MLNSEASTGLWAEEEFGQTALQDHRNVQRLIVIAQSAAQRPHGRLSAVFENAAALQGAYDWVENPQVDIDSVARASHEATARRCAGHGYVFVAVDGSSLTISDRAHAKGTGPIGTLQNKGRGIKMMSALAIDPQGVPLGLSGQQWWVRPETSRQAPHTQRKTEEKETQRWLDVRAQTRAVLEDFAPGTRPWFQLDREADSWPVVLEAFEARALEYTTIRASWNRRVDTPKGMPQRYLKQALEVSAIQGWHDLEVSAAPKRRARRARLQVRACEVTLHLRNHWTRRTVSTVRLWAVWIYEQGTVPPGETPIEWMLLTTYPVHTFEDAKRVVFGYAQRWRIEDYHKALKSGACEIEQTQLRNVQAIVKWAVVLSAVATRLLRLTYLARTQPQTPASQALDPYELQALDDLQSRRTPQRLRTQTLADAVQQIASLGGYTGKSSGGPPGMITLGRGLRRVLDVAQAYRHRDTRLASFYDAHSEGENPS